MRRRPVVTALTFLLALVSILGFAGVAWQWHEAEMARIAEWENRKKVERLTAELLELYSRLDGNTDANTSAKKPIADRTSAEDGFGGDLVHEKSDVAEEVNKRDAPPAPSAAASNLRRGVSRASEDPQTLDRTRKQTANQLELKAQFDNKINELREVAPDLADQYQQLEPH